MAWRSIPVDPFEKHDPVGETLAESPVRDSYSVVLGVVTKRFDGEGSYTPASYQSKGARIASGTPPTHASY